MTNLLDLGLEQKESFKSIPAGRYDAVIHGIVHLGLQPQKPDMTTGKEKPPCNAFKFIFEFPDFIRNDGQTGLISKDVFNKDGEKGNLYKIYAACFGNKMSKELLLNTPVEEVLGKKLAIDIVEWESEKTGKSGSAIAKDTGISYLDTRLAAVAEPATRPTFFFTPLNPDLQVFKETLTHWTQKTVMEALNAASYPKELHEAWAEIQKVQTVTTGAANSKESIE